MIRKAGGPHKWNRYSDIKKAERKAAMIEEGVTELGKEAFNNLSNEEKSLFQLFTWAGCGCHKDLNTVKGGYLAIAAWWYENELEEECSVLLEYVTLPHLFRKFQNTLESPESGLIFFCM